MARHPNTLMSRPNAKIVDRAVMGSSLKKYVGFAFQAEHAARVGRSGGVSSPLQQDPLDLEHLLRVRIGQLAALDENAVLESDAHIAAEKRRLRDERHLMPPGGEHGPLK